MDRQSNHPQLAASELTFNRVRRTWINPARFTMKAGDEAFDSLLGKDGFMLAPAESITAQRSEVTSAHQRRVTAMGIEFEGSQLQSTELGGFLERVEAMNHYPAILWRRFRPSG
jgi:hypothetical protein